MATLTQKPWQVSSYTNDTWADLVAEASVVNFINIANTDVAAINIEIRRVSSGGTELARLLPLTSIPAGGSYRLDGPFSITTSKIQVKCSAAGMHFDANGYVDA